MTVIVRYHNGACLTTRELVDADRCPKCASLAFTPLCKRSDHEGSHAPVRCSLCETEYATVVPLASAYAELREYWGTGDRLQASVDAGVQDWLRETRECFERGIGVTPLFGIESRPPYLQGRHITQADIDALGLPALPVRDPDAFDCRVVYDGNEVREWPADMRVHFMGSKPTLRQRLAAAWAAFWGRG